MILNRRDILAAWAGIGTTLLGFPRVNVLGAEPERTRMGVVIHSYGIRRSTDKESHLEDPLSFLDYCRRRGAGGVQTSLGVREEAYAARVREQLAKYQLFLEGSIRLPRNK